MVRPKVRHIRPKEHVRTFLRVPAFDQMQNPKRPKRPTWLKLFVRDLEDPEWVKLTLTVRGFVTEFQKLAASMENRVPDDTKFIARKIGVQPAVAGKALNTCLTHGFLVRFAEDLKTSKNNDIKQKTGFQPIPSSLSNSDSKSSGVERSSGIAEVQPCPNCDGEGCHWCYELFRRAVQS